MKLRGRGQPNFPKERILSSCILPDVAVEGHEEVPKGHRTGPVQENILLHHRGL